MNRIQLMRRIGLVAVMLFVLAVQANAGHVLLEADGALALKNDVHSDDANSFAIAFDLSQIPKGALIDLAELKLTVDADTSLGRSINVLVHSAQSSWTASEAVSAERLTTSDTLFSNNFVRAGEDKTVEINVTELVKLWHNGSLDNNGFVVSAFANTDKRLALSQDGARWKATLLVFYSNNELE